MKKYHKILLSVVSVFVILFCLTSCDGNDGNDALTPSYQSGNSENAQTQAGIVSDLVGSWKHEENMTSENEVYGRLTMTLKLNNDGTYEKTSDLTVDKDKFINAFISEVNSNTEEEINAYLKMYGFSSVREYAEDYYTNEVETLIKELTYEKSGTWKADGSKIYTDSSSFDYSFSGSELIIDKNSYIKQ